MEPGTKDSMHILVVYKSFPGSFNQPSIVTTIKSSRPYIKRYAKISGRLTSIIKRTKTTGFPVILSICVRALIHFLFAFLSRTQNYFRFPEKFVPPSGELYHRCSQERNSRYTGPFHDLSGGLAPLDRFYLLLAY